MNTRIKKIITSLQSFIWVLPFVCFFAGYYFLHHLAAKPAFEVPTVVGLPLQEAIRLLSEHKLHMAIQAEQTDYTLQQGTIISQTPQATMVKAGQTVHVVVAQAAPQLLAPQLQGKRLEACKHEAEKLHIKLKVYGVPSDAPEQLCVSQLPAPGQQLTENRMTLYFSNGSNPLALFPDLRGRPVDEVVEFLQIHGIKPIISYVGTKSTHAVVAEQRPLPGTIINRQRPQQVQLQCKAV